MATKEDLYKAFGPMLMEAVLLVIKDEINALRAEAGLGERTTEQVVNAVSAKLETVERHDIGN